MTVNYTNPFAGTDRFDLAKRLASGLRGWMDCLAARKIGYLTDEDAARVEACQIIHAQRHSLFVHKHVVPLDWNDQAKHVDIGISIQGDTDPVLHGALELKWSSTKFSGDVRKDIVQDVIRLAHIHPERDSVRFLLMGGMLSLDSVFTDEHAKAELNSQRDFLCDLLAQRLTDPKREVSLHDLVAAFPNAFKRLPNSVPRASGKLRTELMARATVSRDWNHPDHTDGVVVETSAEVRVWQIDTA